MRHDMAKVVTERPRRGHSAPSLKTSFKIHPDHYEDDDHGPRRHPISRKRQFGYDAKEFSDLLGPLRAYLRKQVGRSWNSIYSELSKTLDKKSLAGIHIWGHIKDEVKQHVYFIGKIPFEKSGWRWGPWPVRGLYVHPTTGLLCEAPPFKQTYPKKETTEIKIAEMEELHKREGIWYHIKFEMQPDWYPKFDKKTGTIIHVRRPKDKKVEIFKKQLSSKELKLYKLENTPTQKPISRSKIRAISSKVRAGGS